MSALRFGYILAPLLGALWSVVIAIVVAVVVSFATGAGLKPVIWSSLVVGAVLGIFALPQGGKWSRNRFVAHSLGAVLVVALVLFGWMPLPLVGAEGTGVAVLQIARLLYLIAAVWGLRVMLAELPWESLTRYEFEAAIIRFLTGFGYIFFTALVAIPFYVMVMTSLKSQQALLQNPLDFSLDWEKGWGLLRSYSELFGQFNFGSYLLTSAFVAVMTVLITLLFSVPGAYAVARLRFKGRAAMGRSILLIYMVPMIVLALPIYIAFSMLELRNSLTGILLIYPVTTIPVALYMLQGYFRGLPAEVEEAGLMDGLSRLAVIWKITLPLSLPAMASVSLYVFMIAWNEFLLAFMLLDDPSKFTLTRGIASLNSSEIPRQHLMAGSVIATVPIMLIFLGLERFMTKGLTAGSVKG